jgi:hypothetical protein
MAEVKRYKTPVFRLSFPALFEAKSYDGGEPKYGCSAVWDPSKFSDQDKKLWKELEAAIDAESMNRFKKKAKDLPANFKQAVRDGKEKADLEGYGDGKRFASLSTKMKPGAILLDKTDGSADDFYPGCYCRATVTVYSYDNKGKGVALGLMNIQKVKDGERLDSRTDAAEDFDDEVDASWLEDGDDENLLDN